MTQDQRSEMLQKNIEQTSYYDQTDGGSVSSLNSFMTNAWRRLRLRASQAVSDPTRAQFYEIHKTWLGDIGDAKVLELGSGSGTPLSHWLAQNACSYHALDLSGVQIEQLKHNLGRAPNRHFHVGDFLSDAFSEQGFDVIYAHSVLHHFRYISPALDKIKQVGKPGCRIVTLDPTQTWLPARLFRAVFRPFQTDAAWEYPFDRETLTYIEDHFEVTTCLGLFRKAKWALIMGMLSPGLGRRFGDKWYREDLNTSVSGRKKFAAIQISYLLSVSK